MTADGTAKFTNVIDQPIVNMDRLDTRLKKTLKNFCQNTRNRVLKITSLTFVPSRRRSNVSNSTIDAPGVAPATPSTVPAPVQRPAPASTSVNTAPANPVASLAVDSTAPALAPLQPDSDNLTFHNMPKVSVTSMSSARGRGSRSNANRQLQAQKENIEPSTASTSDRRTSVTVSPLYYEVVLNRVWSR